MSARMTSTATALMTLLLASTRSRLMTLFLFQVALLELTVIRLLAAGRRRPGSRPPPGRGSRGSDAPPPPRAYKARATGLFSITGTRDVRATSRIFWPPPWSAPLASDHRRRLARLVLEGHRQVGGVGDHHVGASARPTACALRRGDLHLLAPRIRALIWGSPSISLCSSFTSCLLIFSCSSCWCRWKNPVDDGQEGQEGQQHQHERDVAVAADLEGRRQWPGWRVLSISGHTWLITRPASAVMTPTFSRFLSRSKNTSLLEEAFHAPHRVEAVPLEFDARRASRARPPA